MESLVELFVDVDDFWQANRAAWYEHLLESGTRQRIREKSLSESEIMTIIILFHQSGYREFKTFYLGYVCRHLKSEFPGLVSYSRFVRFMSEVGLLLFAYLRSCLGNCSGISFIDSTSLIVCHNRRINQHRVFDGFAQRGKTTRGWFFGFKLHLIVSDTGELLDFALTVGNVDDRQPVPDLVQRIFGKLFGDKGYLSKALHDELWEQGVDLITTVRSNMKPQIMKLADRLLLRKRFIIETINDQLKNISQIEHTRHRSVNNFVVNLMAGLIAYCHQPSKPAIQYDSKQLRLLLES
jgi:hypothetical protein